MAADFWASYQSKQLLSVEEVSRVAEEDLELGLTLQDTRLIKIAMTTYMRDLAQQAKLRQRVVATAVCYMRRMYVSKSLCEYDPRLVAPACLYLASKAEESVAQAKLLVFYAKKLKPGPENGAYQLEVKDLLDMELRVLEALDFRLVVYHPYRAAVQYLNDAKLTDVMQTTWSLLNDVYRTDLPLLHPPHVVALGCIHLAAFLKDRDAKPWLEDLKADMHAVRAVQMELLDHYEQYANIDPALTAAAMAKLPIRTRAART
ncbi:Cyclin family protein [Klebsormidium nitens]|uniref:Cyclin family protein n=1 Tax=Klebsormidium nitens TaxID=105231 RepID=A0A1Y1IH67_KLENI|nr:Cyclin family protein [Klebsormidium nitens]|eukprot:GAQ90210.1 Cyclin family protein [Klebsormidium nitens]